MTDDFYIGYLPTTSPRLAAYVRRTVLLLVVAFVGVAALLVTSMGGFSNSVYEWGVEREFEGVISERPVPTLIVERPGVALEAPDTSSYLLVAVGKFGASGEVAGLHGHRVRLTGTLIYRDDQTMVELVAGSIEDLGDGASVLSQATDVDLGIQTLTGEIVDSKCFLGVMKPGNLKPHRACAIRCISGGIPPVLLVRDDEGSASYYLLVSADGNAVNADVLDRVAEPVRIEGRVVRRGARSFLYADPATYR